VKAMQLPCFFTCFLKKCAKENENGNMSGGKIKKK
jgi:hypothetical protein